MSLQETFDNLQMNDFVQIAEAAANAVSEGRVQKEVLVNLSTPDIMIFDPKLKNEYKHVMFEIHNRDILICIGLD